MRTSNRFYFLIVVLLTVFFSTLTQAQEMKVIKIIDDKIAGDRGSVDGIRENTKYEIRRVSSDGVEIIGYAQVIAVKENVCALRVTELERFESVKIDDVLYLLGKKSYEAENLLRQIDRSEPKPSIDKSFWTIYGNLSFPQGDFGDNSGENAGYAQMGYGGGVEFATLIKNTNGLYFFIGANLIFNPIDGNEIRKVFEAMFSGYSVDYTAGSWMNIPFLGGLKFQSIPSGGIQFYINGGIGLNLVKGPNMDLTVGGETVKISYNLSTSFAFGIGGGLVINENINIGIKYLNMDEPEVAGELDYPGGTEELDGYDQPVSVWLLGLGIQL
jgi:hypothetical protein